MATSALMCSHRENARLHRFAAKRSIVFERSCSDSDQEVAIASNSDRLMDRKQVD